ncbi:putative serine/threonine-protein kinase haspin homolog [Agrilus planipennis]|uniref:non-specific serine/threonine protein kinase n=1 Tax=Agrilus planipennis TaxID=224129 RepID=A0A1W4XET0_AGRPL|nr:putative serine/threonine-protein kinase haspin homolog [Agrilus planipennis]
MHYRLEKAFDCHEKCLHTYVSAGIIPDNTQNETLEEKFGRISVNEPHNNDNQIDDDNDAIVKLQQPLPIQFAPLSAKDQAKAVVFEKCRQTEPLPFSECYPDSILQNCFKIGEGVYGEVFQFRGENGKPTVMKIIPIEGDQLVNGEVQKKFEEIMTEIVIAMELSSLRNNNTNITNTFSELQRVRCVKGRWPARLLDLWDLYDEDRKSENDSPEIFGEDQLYITLELANGGRDLEAFGFTNALQAFSVFQQVSCALAVAEESLEFEHRDLHWGNVLVSIVDHDKTVSFVLNGKNITLETYGVEASIIDFTLSRITKSNCCIFTDVSNDLELFTAEGDYQFEIYRLMKKRNGNEWEHFEPYTNVLWLHYLLDKAVTALRYRSTKSKLHKEYIRKLRNIKDVILEYTSVKDYVINNFQFTF